jgi:low temperature requirement protein LtrA
VRDWALMETASARGRRISTALREGERVTPLELFFDLVFVLAITQCTALMSHRPTWAGVGQGMLVLALLWWAWTAYAWLTSVVDPEEGSVRLVMFAAMAALLVLALCVPGAFGDLALTFALAYTVVRAAHIGLFWIASRDDPQLRNSVDGIAISSAIAALLLISASLLDGVAQAGLWILAIGLDLIEPYLFGAEGWRLVPNHFAERHGLIVIIALGESIVAIGVGAAVGVTAGVVTAAVLGMTLAACIWWAYFDVVAIVSARRLSEAPPGRVQNELARDSYSYIHFLMVAGIILVALGLKKTLVHVSDPLEWVPAFALLGGVSVYLLGLVAFRYRHVHSVNRRRLLLAFVCLALVPLAVRVPALAALAGVTLLLGAVIAYDTLGYGEGRLRLRHETVSQSRR